MRVRALIATGIAFAILLGACGSDSKEDASNTSSDITTVSAESEPRSTSTTVASTAPSAVSPTTAAGGGGTATSTTTARAVDNAPQIILTGCRVGRVMDVRTAVAGSNAGDKWGVVAVEITRTNDEGAQVTQGLRWLGPDTAAGDQWSGTIPGGTGWANTVTVMATTFSNRTTRQQVSLVGTPCAS